VTAGDQPSDAQAFKEATQDAWQSAADARVRWESIRRSWLGPVTQAMLDLARLRPGDRVLDIASGTGEPALSAVEVVGPTGYVLATDISSNMLAVAERTARERGLDAANFQTRVMDGESLELEDASFDAVLSRLGLIFFPDRDRALSEIRRVLRPGGRVALAGFTSPENNRFFSIPIAVIRRRAQLSAPPPGGPGPFSLGDPTVMEAGFRQAGFSDVEVRLVAAPLRLASAAECVRFLRDAFAALHQMLAALSDTEREAAWAEIEGELRAYEGPGGFQIPAELLVGVATR
jgi:SAM-dependent methyltransferase